MIGQSCWLKSAFWFFALPYLYLLEYGMFCLYNILSSCLERNNSYYWDVPITDTLIIIIIINNASVILKRKYCCKNKLDARSVFSNVYWRTLIIYWFYFTQQKCIQYWPDSNKKKETFGSTDIILTKEDVCSDFTVRHLHLQQVCIIEIYTVMWCSVG